MNRCEADLVRRQRALRGAGLRERVGRMERVISFEAGYDHRGFPQDCGGGGHGAHGMTIRFTLLGPAGAVHWVFYANNWVPGNVDRIGEARTEVPASAYAPALLDYDALAVALGYHSPTPLYGGQEERECHILPGGRCHYDGSGLNAKPTLARFFEHGPTAVWADLATYYCETFGAGEGG